MAKPDNSGLKLIERLRSDSERQLNLRAVDDDVREDEYDGVGSTLRQAREQHGLDLFSAASALRIQVSHIDAIENGNFHRLPGATYAVGFMRSYADYLGLDADIVVQRFKEETEIAPAQTKLVFPEPVEETRRPGLRTAFITVLMAAGLYGGWVYLERHGQTPLETVAKPPQRFASLAGEAETAKPAPAPVALPVPNFGAAATPRATEPDTAQVVTASARGESAESENDTIQSAMANAQPRADEAETAPGFGTDVSASERVAAQADAEAGPRGSTLAAASSGPSAEASDTRVTQPGPAERRAQSLTESRPAVAAEPTRVQVAPAETEEAIARADAVAEQGNAEDGASPVEQAAAAEVASIDRRQTAEVTETAAQKIPAQDNVLAQDNVPAQESVRVQDGATADVAASEAGTTEAADVIPAIKPKLTTAALMEDPDGLSGSVRRSPANAEPETSAVREQDDEDGAPSIPQIQARLEPPQPPAIPAAPPPAPRLETGSANDAGLSSGAEQPARRYRPQIYGVSTDNARVIVRATADSWVQVQGADNELLLTRILRAGDAYYAPDRRDLVLMTGNAGAIEVMVDGKVLGTLGPVGAVRRNIGLNAETLRSFVQENSSTRR